MGASTIRTEIRQAIEVLRKEGIAMRYLGRTGRGHMRFEVTLPKGRMRTLIAPSTPSDYRGAANMLAMARRWAREET